MPFSVGFVAAHPARSIRCVVLGKKKRSVALRVLASSFHADAVTEARGGFTESGIHQAAGLTHDIPQACSRETGKGRADGWQFMGKLWLSSRVGCGVNSRQDPEAPMTPPARRGLELVGTKGTFSFLSCPRVWGRLTAKMALIFHLSHIPCNVTWYFPSSRS